MSYDNHLAEDRRLVILRLLESAPGYALNGSVVQSAIAAFAHHVARTVVHADFAWLETQALVTVETVTENVLVATLTPRGLDVALGRARAPGVKRPNPGG